MPKYLLSALAAAGILLAGTGCAESPFKVNTRKDTDSVIVKIADKEGKKVVVNYQRLSNANDLQATLNEYGLRFPGRDVTLEIPDEADPRIEPNVARMVKSAGLGDIRVMEGREMRGTFRSRPVRTEFLQESTAAEPAKAAEAPKAAEPAVAAPVVESPKPAAGQEKSAPVAAAPATLAPAEKTAPAPVAAPAADSVTVFAKNNGEFVVNGSKTVSRDQLAAEFADIAKKNPGAKVRYTSEASAPSDSVRFVYRTAKSAKLGPVSRE